MSRTVTFFSRLVLPPALLRALWVMACLLLAAYLRLDSYPHTYYSDEEIPIAVIRHMETRHSLDTNWRNGLWREPGLGWVFGYDQYNFSSYHSALYYLNRGFDVSGRQWNPAQFNRFTSVVFQLLTLLLVFYTCYYLTGQAGAMAASVFFAVNPLLVVDAHYARPESFLMLVVALAVIFHLLAHLKKRPGGFCIAAFFWGIACACKFSLLPMAALAGLHTLLQPQRKLYGPGWLVSFLTGAFVLAPYLFIHSGQVLDGGIALFQQYFNAPSVSAVSFQRSDLLLPHYLLFYFGAGFWLATVYALCTRQPLARCLARGLLAVSGLYIGIFSLLSFFNESNLSHLAILWCVLLAIASQNLLAWAAHHHLRPALVYGVFLLLVLAPPLFLSWHIHQRVYAPEAQQALTAQVTAFESRLLATRAHSRIVNPLKETLPDTAAAPPVFVKIPWNERNESYRLHRQLLLQGYQLDSSLPLPLGSWPHSQLQSIHFPAAYRYYRPRF